MTLLRYLILLTFLLSWSVSFAQNDGENEDDENTSKVYNLEIQKIEYQFKGTKSFDESALEGIINTSKSDYLLKSDFYTDSKRIQKYYFDNGFLDAHVDTATQMGDDSTKVIAIFIIEEKARYKINKVVYNGIESVDDATTALINRNKILVRDRHYNKAEVQLEITRVLTILVNNGYALAQADIPDIVKFISKDTALVDKVDILLNFTTRGRYNFGKTTITLKDNVYDIPIDDIRRELEYNEGELYNKEKLVLSENRIAKIAIFENGRIQIDKINSAHNIIDLKINATVTNKYELKPEILGYDIAGRFYFGSGLSFTNKYFFGGGRVFTSSLRAMIHNFDFYRFEGLASLYQPHLFDNDQITGTDNFGVTSRYEDKYNITTIKNIASMKYTLKNYTYFNNLVFDWNLSNERVYYDTLKVPLPPDDQDTIFLPNAITNQFTSSLGFSVVHNQVDNLQYPTSGTYAVYSIEESGLLGGLVKKIFNTYTTSYFKVTTQNKIFWDLSNEDKLKGTAVLGTKLVVGNIFQYGENNFTINNIQVEGDLVPSEANYKIGGGTSLRGWPADRLAANVPAEIGGGFIIDGSFEHRTKPFALSKNTLIKDLGFVTFFDYGNVWDSYKSFQLNKIAMAIGGGIRYYTIVGAVRLDLGFRLYDPGASEKQWLFENDLGTIFKSGYKMQIQIGIGNTF